MKGKKLVFAVILSLIVCLLLVPSAFAEEQLTENNSDPQIVDTTGADTDGDNGGSNKDSQNNESTDKPADSGDSESKSDNDSTSDDEVQSGVNDDSSDESKDSTGSDDSDDDTDSDNDSDTDSEEEKQENASEEETESNSEHSSNGDSKLPPQPDIKRFQVELTYNDKVYKMDDLKGGESHDLARIIKELGIEGDIESAIGDADDLFDAAQSEDGWKFNTKTAFNTKQTLTLIVNGVEYVIKVTDENVVTVNDEDELESAFGSAQTIIIGKSFDVNKTYEIADNKTILIDLNGQTLRFVKNGSTMFVNKGEFTLTDNSADKNGKIINVQSGSCILNNQNKAYMNGGTIESSTGNRMVANHGTIEFNDGFTAKQTVGGWASIQNVGKDSLMTVNGGYFESTAPQAMLKNDDWGVLIINGGTFNCNLAIQNSGIKTVINGGNFIKNTGRDIIFGGGKTSTINTAELIVYGGSFASNNLTGYMTDYGCKEEDFDISVSGGLYKSENVKKFISENAVLVKSGNMYAVNESGYELAKSGSTVEIIQAPAGEIDGVPGGVTVINNSKNTIIINGVEVAPGESYTTPTPTAYTEPYSAKYFVIDGKNQEWTKGSNESIMFTLNSSAVTKVLIDGVEVEFEVDKDGKIVISAEVLEALEAGEHIVEFIFADGNCKTNIIIK